MRLTAQGTKTDLGLQGQSQLVTRSVNGPRLPPGVSISDALFGWDPQFSLYDDWGGNQVLTPGGSGSVTFGVTANGAIYVTYGDDAYLEGEPFGTSLGEIGDFTVYTVGSVDSGGAADVHDAFVLSESTFANGSVTVLHRTAGGASGGLIFDAATAATEYQTAATQYMIEQVTFEVTSATIQSWVNGISNGSTAHALDPGSNAGFDRLFLGGLNNSSIDKAGTGFYCIVLPGTREAAIDTWLATEFPDIGESPNAP